MLIMSIIGVRKSRTAGRRPAAAIMLEMRIRSPDLSSTPMRRIRSHASGEQAYPQLERSEVGSDRRRPDKGRPDKEGFGLAMSKRRRDRRSAGLARLA